MYRGPRSVKGQGAKYRGARNPNVFQSLSSMGKNTVIPPYRAPAQAHGSRIKPIDDLPCARARSGSTPLPVEYRAAPRHPSIEALRWRTTRRGTGGTRRRYRTLW